MALSSINDRLGAVISILGCLSLIIAPATMTRGLLKKIRKWKRTGLKLKPQGIGWILDCYADQLGIEKQLKEDEENA